MVLGRYAPFAIVGMVFLLPATGQDEVATPEPQGPQVPPLEQTMAALKQIGLGLASYVGDYTGVPLDVDLNELYRGDDNIMPLEGVYLTSLPGTDAWGTPWRYEPDTSLKRRVEFIASSAESVGL